MFRTLLGLFLRGIPVPNTFRKIDVQCLITPASAVNPKPKPKVSCKEIKKYDSKIKK